MVKPLFIYDVEPPDGHPFKAMIADDGGKAIVLSTRHGNWGKEELLTAADLVMPEQKFADWNITEVSKGDGEVSSQDTEVSSQDTDDELPKIDRSHDVRWMSIMSKDGRTMYVDRHLPDTIEISGKYLDPAQPLLQHELAEWQEMRRSLDKFKAEKNREPIDRERYQIYLHAHNNAGTPAEKQWLEQNGYDVAAWMEWTKGKLAELEHEKERNPPPNPDVHPFPHHHGELEVSMDSMLAFDKSMSTRSRLGPHISRKGLAFDKDTVRSFDVDGRLHVSSSNISKAAVNPYRGHEIPDWQKLGLDPDRIYYLLRDPDELAKAASTFNNLPLLAVHSPVSAKDHPSDLVIGSTGTDAVYEHPYLKNSLVFWPQAAIDVVEDGTQRELSCAYRYHPDMTPGMYEGKHYDGVMRDIAGNHVALVESGRVGDAIVADSTEGVMHMSARKVILTRKAAATQGALMAYLRPLLAKDAKLDLAPLQPLLSRLTSKNFAQQKPKLLDSIKKAFDGKLAKDADVEGLVDLLDALEETETHEAGTRDALETNPSSGIPMAATAMPKLPKKEVEHKEEVEKEAEEAHDIADQEELVAFLKEKGLDEEDISHILEMAGLHREAEDVEEEEPEEEKMKKLRELKKEHGEDTPPEFRGMPKTGGEMVSKKAMDAALAKVRDDAKIAADAAIKAERMAAQKNAKEIRDAENVVRPWVGTMAMAHDNAADVYKTALTALGIKTDGVHPSAYRVILEREPLPGARRGEHSTLAMDRSDVSDFAKRHPNTARITVMP